MMKMLKKKSEECKVGHIDKYLTFPSEYPWTSENIKLWEKKGCHSFDKIAEEVFNFVSKNLDVPCIVLVWADEPQDEEDTPTDNAYAHLSVLYIISTDEMKIVVQHELMGERCAPKTPLCVDKFVNELKTLSGDNWDFLRSFGEQTDENRDCVQRCSLQISDLGSFITTMKTFVSSPESPVESKTLAVSDHSGVFWGNISSTSDESNDDELSDIVSDSGFKNANSELQTAGAGAAGKEQQKLQTDHQQQQQKHQLQVHTQEGHQQQGNQQQKQVAAPSAGASRHLLGRWRQLRPCIRERENTGEVWNTLYLG